MLLRVWSFVIAFVPLLFGAAAFADEKHDAIAAALKALDARVVPEAERDAVASQLGRDIAARLREANEKSTAEWNGIRNRSDWEAFRATKLKALRESLGAPITDHLDACLKPPAGSPRVVRVGKPIAGEGFQVERVVYEDPWGLWVSANLYRPAAPGNSMPGIILSHSHHAPKTSGELQDMGQTWARAGCVVLVPDHLGHGERRQHPFATAESYAKPFKVDRQDYYFRFDIGMQWQFAGGSLPGLLAGDLIVGVNVLLAEKGVDPKRIILLGGVAGGGDPAAIAAALDERIACAVIFNFGGPQPETKYPLPADAETSFNYAGSGSWESTRNLRRSAADGFLPWVIVGSIAPRKLIYAHEFSWDRERDPVWRRLERIWSFYDASESLGFAHGLGTLTGKNPEGSHCMHIGAVHRKLIHPQFEKWFGIKLPEGGEYSKRIPSTDLLCFTSELPRDVKVRPLNEVLLELYDKRMHEGSPEFERKLAASKDELAFLRAECTTQMRASLGNVEPSPAAAAKKVGEVALGETKIRVARYLVRTESNIVVPIITLFPEQPAMAKAPVVVCVAQPGKGAFLKQRSEQIVQLLSSGVAVCLPDLRGMGEACDDGDRGPYGSMTSYSSSELMLGGTMLGAQLRDLRAVIADVRKWPEIDGVRVGIWGESFTPPLAEKAAVVFPWRVDDRPPMAEPAAAHLAELAALFDGEIRTIMISGALTWTRYIFEAQCVYVPYGAMTLDLTGSLDFHELFIVVVAKEFTGVDSTSVPLQSVHQTNAVDMCNRTIPYAGEQPTEAFKSFIVEVIDPEAAKAKASAPASAPPFPLLRTLFRILLRPK